MKNNYEQKYKKALDNARLMYDAGNNDVKHIVGQLFPELAESEDEKVRKEIVRFIQMEVEDEIVGNKWLAWLGKQCQVKEPHISQHENRTCKENNNSLTYEDEKVRKALLELVHDTTGDELWIDYNVHKEEALDWLKRQGEQKPADKVEPKFHEGEWVVNKLGDLWHIDSFDKKNYQVSDGKGNYNYFPISKQGEMRLWTIQDAKDGDVLACPNDAGDRDVVFIFKNINSDEGWVFCFCASDANGCFCTNNDYVGNSNSTNISPATKEQCDLLFQKMHEAGYEWDDEKKELKKIEPKTEENKGNLGGISPNWSEEDGMILSLIVNSLKFIRDTLSHDDKYTVDVGSFEGQIEWLKSLQDRVQPQPKQEWSEEDKYMYDILCGTIENTDINENTKYKLISWLKSLQDRVGCEANCTTTKEWSEEDINMIDWLIRCCEEEHKELCNDKYGHQDMVSYLKMDCRKKWDWLESLKNKVAPQNRWKPSDVQMGCLSDAIEHYNSLGYPATKLKELLDDLKKLKDGKV